MCLILNVGELDLEEWLVNIASLSLVEEFTGTGRNKARPREKERGENAVCLEPETAWLILLTAFTSGCNWRIRHVVYGVHLDG